MTVANPAMPSTTSAAPHNQDTLWSNEASTTAEIPIVMKAMANTSGPKLSLCLGSELSNTANHDLSDTTMNVDDQGSSIGVARY